MREMGCMADALWERHTLLKTGVHTDRHTKVKTVYPPVSLRSLGGYKNTQITVQLCCSAAVVCFSICTSPCKE